MDIDIILTSSIVSSHLQLSKSLLFWLMFFQACNQMSTGLAKALRCFNNGRHVFVVFNVSIHLQGALTRLNTFPLNEQLRIIETINE